MKKFTLEEFQEEYSWLLKKIPSILWELPLSGTYSHIKTDIKKTDRAGVIKFKNYAIRHERVLNIDLVNGKVI